MARYSPRDFISLLEKHNIKYHDKKLGQLFCDSSSREIVNMLEKECENADVEIRVNCKVSDITKNNNFIIKTNQGEFETESLVIASGGISIPKMGATDFGYRIAKQFGIKLTKIVPGLVPFTLKEQEFTDLSGVSLDSIVNCNGVSFRENILFTHKGLSGPAILQISSYWNSGDSIYINLLPDKNITQLIADNTSSKMELLNFLAQFLPRRFCEKWCEIYFSTKHINRLTEKEIEYISDKIHNLQLKPNGTEGFNKAEVTKGGVDTNEISSKTMESKKVKGLYFIGEVVDVTGWLGGYNFQWAWASGYAAGQYV